MRRWLIGWTVWAAAVGPGVVAAAAADPVGLKGGDRVVLIGGTWIEREAESGYLETQIARRLPGQVVVVRNLGWSGDTVEGVSRGKPNPPVDGFRALVDHVAALRPTVIVLGYGANESYGGAGGLPPFAAGLDRLWGELARTGAKIVVVTPTPQENLGPPLPDPAAHNADLAQYAGLLQAEAARRGATCVDLFATMPRPSAAGPGHGGGGHWTSNGVHLTPAGYWHASAAIARALLGPPAPDPVIAITDGKATATGATVADLVATPTGWTFHARFDLIPEPPVPAGPAVLSRPRRTIRASGLPPGRYQVAVDGVRIPTVGDPDRGIDLGLDPDVRQVEALRARILSKDRLYFHRWRPQNETYLFGMRKHEQGQNAAELAAFDPMIAAAEAEIARLSIPTPHLYEISRVPEGEVPR